jgi:hypothetical protein
VSELCKLIAKILFGNNYFLKTDGNGEQNFISSLPSIPQMEGKWGVENFRTRVF